MPARLHCSAAPAGLLPRQGHRRHCGAHPGLPVQAGCCRSRCSAALPCPQAPPWPVQLLLQVGRRHAERRRLSSALAVSGGAAPGALPCPAGTWPSWRSRWWSLQPTTTAYASCWRRTARRCPPPPLPPPTRPRPSCCAPRRLTGRTRWRAAARRQRRQRRRLQLHARGAPPCTATSLPPTARACATASSSCWPWRCAAGCAARPARG